MPHVRMQSEKENISRYSETASASMFRTLRIMNTSGDSDKQGSVCVCVCVCVCVRACVRACVHVCVTTALYFMNIVEFQVYFLICLHPEEKVTEYY